MNSVEMEMFNSGTSIYRHQPWAGRGRGAVATPLQSPSFETKLNSVFLTKLNLRARRHSKIYFLFLQEQIKDITSRHSRGTYKIKLNSVPITKVHFS
jgi:hypothetical protein